MNWLEDIMQAIYLDGYDYGGAGKGGGVTGVFSYHSPAMKRKITDKLLNLIEQSKDKDLPLHWLTKEIKAL